MRLLGLFFLCFAPPSEKEKTRMPGRGCPVSLASGGGGVLQEYFRAGWEVTRSASLAGGGGGVPREFFQAGGEVVRFASLASDGGAPREFFRTAGRSCAPQALQVSGAVCPGSFFGRLGGCALREPCGCRERCAPGVFSGGWGSHALRKPCRWRGGVPRALFRGRAEMKHPESFPGCRRGGGNGREEKRKNYSGTFPASMRAAMMLPWRAACCRALSAFSVSFSVRRPSMKHMARTKSAT